MLTDTEGHPFNIQLIQKHPRLASQWHWSIKKTLIISFQWLAFISACTSLFELLTVKRCGAQSNCFCPSVICFLLTIDISRPIFAFRLSSIELFVLSKVCILLTWIQNFDMNQIWRIILASTIFLTYFLHYNLKLFSWTISSGSGKFPRSYFTLSDKANIRYKWLYQGCEFHWKTSQELRILSKSLSDCKSLLLNNVVIQVSQFVSNSQLCHCH